MYNFVFTRSYVLIIFSYGFILNECVNYTNEHVHISGGMLVYIISDIYNMNCKCQLTNVIPSEISTNGQLSTLNYGFYWCWNFCLGKKWRNIQAGEEKYQDIMLTDFRAFCDNNNNRLVKFWNEVNDITNQKMVKIQQEYSNND